MDAGKGKGLRVLKVTGRRVRRGVRVRGRSRKGEDGGWKRKEDRRRGREQSG